MREVMSEFDSERVKKFGMLIDTKKYAELVQVANAVHSLLSVPTEPTTGTLFKNYERMKSKMNHADFLAVNRAHAQDHLRSLNNIHFSFQKEGSPAHFKKTWKYDNMFQWASHACECVTHAHDINDLETHIKSVEAERQVHADAKETAELILADLAEFMPEQMEEQMKAMQNFLLVQCNKGELDNLDMQEAWSQYEGQRFFGNINTMKHSLIESRVK